MRTALIETVIQLARRNRAIWLLAGDLGFSVLEGFRDEFPGRFVNAGIAEQNMMGVAAGLALSGKIVFVYSIANFPTIRCLEQVRNDVCYHGCHVIIVAVGGGYAYGSAGYTHHGVEDLAILRTFPGMTVVAPGDPTETKLAVRAAVERPGPYYLRLGRSNEPVVHIGEPDFAIGEAITVREGNDIVLISTGGMLHECVSVARGLAEVGRSVGVVSMHTLKPIDKDAIVKIARGTPAIVTVEEHTTAGGLGSCVAEVLAGHPELGTRLLRYGIPDTLHFSAGTQAYIRRRAMGSLRSVVAKLMGVPDAPDTDQG